jgi:hypothetical protein
MIKTQIRVKFVTVKSQLNGKLVLCKKHKERI